MAKCENCELKDEFIVWLITQVFNRHETLLDYCRRYTHKEKYLSELTEEREYLHRKIYARVMDHARRTLGESAC